jgi:urease accessory protein
MSNVSEPLRRPGIATRGDAVDGAGRGFVQLRRSGERTAVTRGLANEPLKLLFPRAVGPLAWVVCSTYGGGLVGGDAIDLTVDAGPATRCLLGTQASTKVYRTAGPGCGQSLTVRAGDGAIVVSAPDPVVCFAGARYGQRQRFDLAATASVAAIDWFTSGRHARGERWAFDAHETRTDVYVDGQLIFRDATRLSPADGLVAGPMRTGGFVCIATVLLVGPALRSVADDVLRFVAAQPPGTADGLLFSASPIPDGAILRVAGPGAEPVGQWIKARLAGMANVIGQPIWTRKW